ncbi:MAG: nucleoside hydrolase [Terracidiphilus sp.]|nr:nucleoside hydrolase [Terracidiphilus sp.]
MTKRWTTAVALLLAMAAGLECAQTAARPEPVILDTDIGDDIDDAFALGLILTSPELKLVGVTTTFGDTELRARLVERYLTAAGRGDVPVLAGVKTEAKNVFTQRAYAEQPHGEERDGCIVRLLSLSVYPTPKAEQDRYDACEKERRDAVGFILREAKERPGEITLIAIGALTNVKTAIARDPVGFKSLKRVVLMGGSVDRGYDGQKGERRPPDAEWNFLCDPAGAQALLASGVPVFVMPLDSTQVHLPSAEAERIYAHGSAVTDQITLLYHQWAANSGSATKVPTLFDPVAVTYTFRPDLCSAEPMRLEVDAKGFSRRVEGKPNAEVCLVADEAGFLALLEERLTGSAKH